MRRYIDSAVKSDLPKKMVFLSGPRQVGKTTLAKNIMAEYSRAQYLNWDVVADRKILLDQSWGNRADLLVFDEIHKMREWKKYLKGVFDGKSAGQAILVTGSARLDAFRQSGESLAGRYFSLRLHPISVREWCEFSGASPEDALSRLLERGGFPEPFLSDNTVDADRWRTQYFEGVIREDVLEFSRIHEIRAMRLFVEMLRERVGSTLSLASIARDLQISPTTLSKYLEILESLCVIFIVRPYHANIARAILKEPKVYFFDTGLVKGDEGVRFENACATMLLKHVHYINDTSGIEMSLCYTRDKDGREIDFVVCENGLPIKFIECKFADTTLTPFLIILADRFPGAEAIQLVRDLRQPEQRGRVAIESAARWLAELAA